MDFWVEFPNEASMTLRIAGSIVHMRGSELSAAARTAAAETNGSCSAA